MRANWARVSAVIASGYLALYFGFRMHVHEDGFIILIAVTTVGTLLARLSPAPGFAMLLGGFVLLNSGLSLIARDGAEWPWSAVNAVAALVLLGAACSLLQQPAQDGGSSSP